MKKQIRRAMIGTVAMMLMGVVSLTGVTYAWFSRSDEANVNGLTMEVVSRDGGVYVSTMPYKDFGTSIDITPPAGSVYNPASTAGELDSTTGKLKFFEGYLDSPTDSTLNIEAITGPDNYYIEQDVYFDNSTGSTPVVISLAGTEIVPTDARNTQLAARIAIVTHGSITQTEFNEQKTYPTTTDNANVQIYEYQAGTHTQQGINEYTKNINPSASPSGNFKYYALNSIGNDINRFNDGSPAQLTDMSTSAALKTSADNVIIEVPAGCYLRTTLYVWLEGQDADCQNNISGKPYTAAIKFTKVSGGAAVG